MAYIQPDATILICQDVPLNASYDDTITFYNDAGEWDYQAQYNYFAGKTTTAMTKENIWHGIMSFGGMLMIFLTYCLYTAFIVRKDKEGAGLLSGFLVFSLITGAFAVLNVFDERSYVIASAVSELYVLTMMNLVGYMTYYLAYRKRKAE